MPDVIVVIGELQVFSDPFGDPLVAVSHNDPDIQLPGDEQRYRPLQSFQLHMVAPANFIALKYHKKKIK